MKPSARPATGWTVEQVLGFTEAQLEKLPKSQLLQMLLWTREQLVEERHGHQAAEARLQETLAQQARERQQAITTGASFSGRTDGTQRRRCPSSVFVLALFQICRGIFIAGVVLSIYLMPDVNIASRIDVKVATFIIARQNLTSPVFMVTLPLAAIYYCVTGVGLLRLKMWARNVLVLSSAATVLLWGRRFLFDYAIKRATLKTHLQQQSVYIVICIDAIIFLYLASNSEFFRE